jgi:ParB-like chromosome segregation protein Spo0J
MNINIEARMLVNQIAALPEPERIDIINQIRLMIHEVSPMKNEPVDCVLWVKNDSVYANDYNPNSVAPPEMKLLEHSIQEDGYTQPIVTMKQEIGREVIDGFHRHRVGKESELIQSRVHGYLPVVTINEHRTDRSDRMASTIRHNRARGKHKVESMSEIVLELKRRNWSDQKISKELGMDADEVLRLYQITGLADMFKDHEFTQAWEVDLIDESDSIETYEENV